MVYMFIHYRSILIDVSYSVYAGNGIYIFIYIPYLSSPQYNSQILFLYFKSCFISIKVKAAYIYILVSLALN